MATALTDYRRTIPARFDRMRDGSPILCRYCGTAITAHKDVAAVDAAGKWHNVCLTCADSYQAQAVGLLARVEAVAATLADPTPLVAQAEAIDTQAAAAVQGDVAAAKAVIPVLLAMLGLADVTKANESKAEARKSLPAGVAEASRYYDPNRYASRRGEGCLACGQPVGAGEGYAVMTADSRGWGALHRGDCAESTVASRAAAKAEEVTAAGRLMVALGTIAQRTGRESVRVAIPSGGHNDLDFLALYTVTSRVERHVGAPGDVRKTNLPVVQAATLAERVASLSDEALAEAQAMYGQAMHYCGRCGSPLTDKASRDLGLGPECAGKV